MLSLNDNRKIKEISNEDSARITVIDCDAIIGAWNIGMESISE